MAKHEVSVWLGIKNNMARGIKDVDRDLKKFGHQIGHAFKVASVAIIGAGAAIVAVATKALMAYAEQEKATRAITSAFQVYGEEVDGNVAKVQAMAAAIQDETGADDDSLVSMMARMKMLGATTESLGSAAKGVLALTQAGMGEEQAMKAIVAAQNGEFTQLQRYLPLLKSATTEAEKAGIVNDFLAKGYQATKDQLGTVGGSWAALKGRVGDAWEEVGKAIAQNSALTGVLQQAGDKVKELTARFAEWAAGGGVTNLIALVKLFGENLRNTFAVAAIGAEGFFKGAIWNPGKAAFDYVGSVIGTFVNLAVTEFEYLRDMAVAVWEKIKNPLKTFEPPNLNGVTAAFDELAAAVKGEYNDKIPNAFVEMDKKLIAEQNKHTANTEAINKKRLESLKAANAEHVENTTTALEKIDIARENSAKAEAERAKKLAELEKEKLELEKEYSEELSSSERKAANDAEIAALEKQIALTEEKRKAAEDIAKMSVEDIIAGKRAVKDADDAAADEERKAKRLENRAKSFEGGLLGGKMNKADAEWLAAWREKQKGKVDAELAKFFGEVDKMALDDLKRMDSKNLKTIADKITNVDTQIGDLLKVKE